MSNRGIAVVGVRLLALYVLLRVLFLLPQALEQWLGPDRDGGPAVAVVLAGLAAAAYLWFGVGTLAGWMVPSRTAQSLDEQGRPGDELPATLVFAAAGALLLAWSLPELLVKALRVYSANTGSLLMDADPALLTEVTVAALRTLLGLAVMLGSAGLVRVIHHLRRTGAG